MSAKNEKIGVWFPTIKTNTGTDKFTIRLAHKLTLEGLRAEITWLPQHAEYAPFLVKQPQLPPWANIIHIDSWMPSKFSAYPKPSVVTIHSCVHDPALAPYKNIFQKLYHSYWIRHCENRNLKQAFTITSVSRYTAKATKLIFPCKNIETIYNWIDYRLYKPINEKKKNMPFRLLFVGKPSRRKGTDLLPKIMKMLGDDYILHCTCTKKDLKDSDSAIPKNIKFIGWQNEVSLLLEEYQKSDAFLFPSRLEGLSLAQLEAQSCGLPIIGFDSSSTGEVVIDGKTGFLSQVDDVQSVVESIKKLKKSDELWSRMRIAARNNIIENFEEDYATLSYINIYKKIVQNGHAA